MDGTWITGLVQEAGVVGAMALIFLVGMITIVVLFLKQGKANNYQMTEAINKLSEGLTNVIDKISHPYLDTTQSLDLFRSVMRDHIWKKLNIIGDILAKNNIHDREGQIKVNVNREFKTITTQEAERLSKYKSVCGDMGKILNKEIEWDHFLGVTFSIMFSSDKDHRKIKDIHTMMNAEVDKIAHIIEDNGIRN